MKQVLFIVVVSLIAFSGSTQLPNKAKRLIGKWQYKSGAGYEVWKMDNDALDGAAFRISKSGDTTQVEHLTIRKVNKTLVYILETNRQQGDSIVVQKNSFVGVGNKMKFNNLESTVPSFITYSFGCFSKNKLRIKIQFGVNEDPILLELRRYKATKN